MENPFPVAGDSDNSNLTSYIVAGGAALGGALAMWLYKKLTAPDTEAVISEQVKLVVAEQLKALKENPVRVTAVPVTVV